MRVPAYLAAFAFSVSRVAFAGLEAGFDPGAIGGGDDHHEIIDRYLSATQTNKPSGIQMDAQVEAALPKLRKKGRLDALRTISKLGKITWDSLRFSIDTDATIKKEVIARFIQTEQEQTDTSKMAIDRANYKFKYKGLEYRSGQHVYCLLYTSDAADE